MDGTGASSSSSRSSRRRTGTRLLCRPPTTRRLCTQTAAGTRESRARRHRRSSRRPPAAAGAPPGRFVLRGAQPPALNRGAGGAGRAAGAGRAGRRNTGKPKASASRWPGAPPPPIALPFRHPCQRPTALDGDWRSMCKRQQLELVVGRWLCGGAHAIGEGSTQWWWLAGASTGRAPATLARPAGCLRPARGGGKKSTKKKREKEPKAVPKKHLAGRKAPCVSCDNCGFEPALPDGA